MWVYIYFMVEIVISNLIWYVVYMFEVFDNGLMFFYFFFFEMMVIIFNLWDGLMVVLILEKNNNSGL